MNSSLWISIILIGLLTFFTRLSFILLSGKWKPPETFQRALRFVPVAVFSAIILPELVWKDGNLWLSPANPRLLAGLVAILVAWRTKNVVWTIAVGMAVLLLLQWVIL